MICACTVTSSAVVGSSAISSSGSFAMAMAIMTRWRMPPDSSCGYWPQAPFRDWNRDQPQQLERTRCLAAVRDSLRRYAQRIGLNDLLADRSSPD